MKHRARHSAFLQVVARLPVILALFLSPPAGLAQDPNAPSQPPVEEDIRGPREAIAIPVPAKTRWDLWLGAAAALAVMAGLFWQQKNRRAAVLRQSPLEQAREALRRIDADRTTLPAGDLAERTAGVVRHFIAANFGIAAPQRTTEEFFTWLAHTKDSPLQVHTDVLQAFLKSCDMAKFAGAEFDGVERFALLETANRFVQTAAYIAPSGAASAPVPSPVPPSVPPAVPSPTP